MSGSSRHASVLCEPRWRAPAVSSRPTMGRRSAGWTVRRAMTRASPAGRVRKPFYFFKQKTAYEMPKLLEFRRVLFRSNALMEAIAHGCPVLCAGGKGGILEVMEACGLGDCIIADDSFEKAFVERVGYVLSRDTSS